MLDQHPGVYMASIKEPHFFSTDRYRLVRHRYLYNWLFALAPPGQLRGEASTSYLSSFDAVPGLLKTNPNVKIIAIVRNPVDMFISWHNECVRYLDEDVEDPEQAWHLPASRKIPKHCKDRVALDYRFICSIGSQLGRLKNLVPPRNLLILVLDDLKRDVAATYLQVLYFLGLPDDGRRVFPVENQFSRHASNWFAAYRHLAEVWPPITISKTLIRPLLKRAGIEFFPRMQQRGVKPIAKPALTEAFREELWAAFQPEVATLEAILNRPLSHWAPKAVSSG